MADNQTANNTMELMTHFVAGYPSMEASYEIALALARGGADYLEMQFPFSDPSADGPVIQKACAEALEAGFTLAKGWELLSRLTAELPATPVYVMSYGNLVFTPGVDAFAAEAARRGAAGLIVPDLVPGADDGLYEAGRRHGLDVVPVTAPSLTPERLERILAEKPKRIYAALRRGITGAETALDEATLAYLRGLRSGGAQLIAGFGLRRAEQLKALAGYAECAVAGSVFVEAAPEGPAEVEKRARELKEG